MLNMGFVDDVEMILNAGGSSENMQTLLFSATLPPWVKDITRRFLRKEQRLVDLVGSQKMKVWQAASPKVSIAIDKLDWEEHFTSALFRPLGCFAPMLLENDFM